MLQTSFGLRLLFGDRVWVLASKSAESSEIHVMQGDVGACQMDFS